MTRLLSIGAAFILLLLTLCLYHPVAAESTTGLCLASPAQWNIPRFLGWFLDTLAIALAVFLITESNKKFLFVHEGEPVVSMGLLLIAACSCPTTVLLSSSTLMLLVNVGILFLLFLSYESWNASRSFFLMASTIAIGSMFQYAFLFMIPVCIGGGLMMKSFHIRELFAFIFGLAAPYWIAIGLGWVSFDSFRSLEIHTAFSAGRLDASTVPAFVGSAILAIGALVMALYNGLRLYSRNSRLRCMHLTINLLGMVAGFALIFDHSNFLTYYGTLSLWFAVEIASVFDLYQLRKPQIALLISLLIFLPIYIIQL